jgi:hypothetical protein
MPQVERREARASDRKEAQHAGRTVSHLVCGVQSGYASRSRGFARPGVWAALRFLLFRERGEAAQSSGVNAPRERARISSQLSVKACRDHRIALPESPCLGPGPCLPGIPYGS